MNNLDIFKEKMSTLKCIADVHIGTPTVKKVLWIAWMEVIGKIDFIASKHFSCERNLSAFLHIFLSDKISTLAHKKRQKIRERRAANDAILGIHLIYHSLI